MLIVSDLEKFQHWSGRTKLILRDTAARNAGTGDYIYWVSQRKGTEPIGDLDTRYAWIPRLAVCDNGGGETTRFGGVPVDSGIKAYVYPAVYGLIEETMVFCGAHQNAWITTEADRTASSLHYRNLHVEIGSEPSDAQLALTQTLLGSGIELPWLRDFAVQTVIHESTHAVAFVGDGNKLGKHTHTPPASLSRSPSLSLHLQPLSPFLPPLSPVSLPTCDMFIIFSPRA